MDLQQNEEPSVNEQPVVDETPAELESEQVEITLEAQETQDSPVNAEEVEQVLSEEVPSVDPLLI